MARRAQVNWAKLQELRKSGYFEKLRKLSTGKMRPGVAKGSLGILLGLALLPIMAAAGDE